MVLIKLELNELQVILALKSIQFFHDSANWMVGEDEF